LTILLDDHLLRDWMVGPDRDLVHAVAGESLATTNLWYARLCKSAVRSARGALLGDLTLGERRALVAGLVTLPDEITVVPMRELAWRMAVLVSEEGGLSTLGSEAVAAGEALEARLLVSSRDDSPGIRRTCGHLNIGYASVDR